MLPNVKKLNADAAYMSSMSSVEIERKNATLNELRQDAKQLYYSWIILKKRLHILDQNDKVLDFMIQNAEIRYQNGVDKISAYYKAKAASGNVKNMKLMYENDIREKRIRLNTLMGRNAFTEFDYFSSDRNYFVTPIINSPCKLVAYINAKPATVVKNPITFFPNKIEVIYIGFIIFVIAYLILCSIVL